MNSMNTGSVLQGLGNLRYIGQDLVVRGNAGLTTLDGLTKSLNSVGAFRGADVYIEDNPKLGSLAGLGTGKAAIYGNVYVQGNPGLPETEVTPLMNKAVPVPITVEVLQYGLPKNASRSAAVGAANATAQPSAAASVQPAAGAANATAPAPAAAVPVVNGPLPGAAAAPVNPAGPAAAGPAVVQPRTAGR